MSLSVLLLTGCAAPTKDSVNTRIRDLINKDQEHEQGFVVTSAMVYDNFYEESNGIDLSSQELTGVPDLCALIQPEDYYKVRHLDLSDNAIKIVDQDLSCLENLKTLNLSYNEIEVVRTLWILPLLTDLKLHKNNLTSTSGLPDFPALERLNLGYNQLKEAVGLDKYQNIKVLELYHNQLESLVWVEGLAKLEELKVEFNNIKDFSFFEDLKDQGLKIMTAKGNEVKDSFLDELKQMNSDYIEWLKGDLEIGTDTPVVEVNSEVEVQE